MWWNTAKYIVIYTKIKRMDKESRKQNITGFKYLGIKNEEISKLEKAEINKLKISLKNLVKQCKRIKDMIEGCEKKT